jgi:hypothetical protein
MRVGERCTCLFCLTRDSFELKLDKKSRPYFGCKSCGLFCFLRGDFSMKGPAILWGPLTAALVDGKPELARALVDRASENVAHG